MALEIRQTQLDDVRSMIELLLGYFHFYEWPSPSKEKIESYVRLLVNNEHTGIQFIATVNGYPVGFATLYFSFSTSRLAPITVMNDLYVEPENRGKQVGYGLMRECITYTRNHGFATMEWVTAKDNDRAIRLYDAMGGNKSEWLFYHLD